MALFDGRLYVAYGDFIENTGPVHALSVTIGSGAVNDEATLDTEQTWPLRVIDDVLWAPFMDPRSGATDVAHATAAGVWSSAALTPDPVHVWDVVSTPDGLFLLGTTMQEGQEGGTIWRSIDDGATWAEDLFVPSDDLGRFLCGWEIAGYLFAMLSKQSTLSVYVRAPGGGWSHTDGAPVACDALSFSIDDTPFALVLGGQGKPAGVASDALWYVVVAPGSELTAEQVTASIELPATITDTTLSEDGESLYVLTAAATVWRGTRAGDWQRIARVDAPVGDETRLGLLRSIAVDEIGGYIYFGTTDSRVLRIPMPA